MFNNCMSSQKYTNPSNQLDIKRKILEQKSPNPSHQHEVPQSHFNRNPNFLLENSSSLNPQTDSNQSKSHKFSGQPIPSLSIPYTFPQIQERNKSSTPNGKSRFPPPVQPTFHPQNNQNSSGIQVPQLRDLNQQRTIVRLKSRQNNQSYNSSPKPERSNHHQVVGQIYDQECITGTRYADAQLNENNFNQNCISNNGNQTINNNRIPYFNMNTNYAQGMLQNGNGVVSSPSMASSGNTDGIQNANNLSGAISQTNYLPLSTSAAMHIITANANIFSINNIDAFTSSHNREASAEKNMKLSCNINELENEWSKLKKQHNFDSRSQSPFRLYMKQNSLLNAYQNHQLHIVTQSHLPQGNQNINNNQNLSENCEFDEHTLYGSGQKRSKCNQQVISNFIGISNNSLQQISNSNSLTYSGSKQDGGHHPHNVIGGKSSQNIIKKSVPLSKINLQTVKQRKTQDNFLNNSHNQISGAVSGQQDQGNLNSAQNHQTSSNINIQKVSGSIGPSTIAELSPIKNYQQTHFKNIIDKYANVHNQKSDCDVNSIGNGLFTNNHNNLNGIKMPYSRATTVSEINFGNHGSFQPIHTSGCIQYYNTPHQNKTQQQQPQQHHSHQQPYGTDNNLITSAVYPGQIAIQNKLKNEVKVSSPKLNNLKGINSNANVLSNSRGGQVDWYCGATSNSFHQNNSVNNGIDLNNSRTHQFINSNSLSLSKIAEGIANNTGQNNSAISTKSLSSVASLNQNGVNSNNNNRDVQSLIMKQIHQMNTAQIYLKEDETLENNNASSGGETSVIYGTPLRNDLNQSGFQTSGGMGSSASDSYIKVQSQQQIQNIYNVNSVHNYGMYAIDVGVQSQAQNVDLKRSGLTIGKASPKQIFLQQNNANQMNNVNFTGHIGNQSYGEYNGVHRNAGCSGKNDQIRSPINSVMKRDENSICQNQDITNSNMNSIMNLPTALTQNCNDIGEKMSISRIMPVNLNGSTTPFKSTTLQMQFNSFLPNTIQGSNQGNVNATNQIKDNNCINYETSSQNPLGLGNLHSAYNIHHHQQQQQININTNNNLIIQGVTNSNNCLSQYQQQQHSQVQQPLPQQRNFVKINQNTGMQNANSVEDLNKLNYQQNGKKFSTTQPIGSMANQLISIVSNTNNSQFQFVTQHNQLNPGSVQPLQIVTNNSHYNGNSLQNQNNYISNQHYNQYARQSYGNKYN